MNKSAADQQLEKDKFVKAKLSGASNTKAAKLANPSLTDSSAKNTGMRLAASVDVQIQIAKTAQQALAEADLKIEDFIQTIKDAREAKKLIVHGKNADDGWTEEVPDWSARLKATDMGLKLLGAYNPIKQPDTPATQLPSAQLADALKNNDISEIQRIVFNTEPNSGTND